MRGVGVGLVFQESGHEYDHIDPAIQARSARHLKLSREEKLDLDVRDLNRIIAGIQAYAGLNPKEFMARLRQHPEDGLCQLTDLNGTGKLQFTKDGHNAIIDVAERHVRSLDASEDYSTEEIATSISSNIVRILVEEDADELAAKRMVEVAEKEAQANHIERTYHFPCVLVGTQNPDYFSIGPVHFSNASAFPKLMADKFKNWVAAKDPEWSAKRLEWFNNYVAELGWVGTVTVPPCATERSKARAQCAIRTAINLLRLLFGIPHAGDMRLAFAPPSRPGNLEFAFEENSQLHLISSRSSQRGALVHDDWHLSMGQFQPFWHRCAHLLQVTLGSKRSEIAERLIDAISWYGEAGAESSPGTQIVKFVIALERLTTIQRFSVHHFCSRVALLSCETDTNFGTAYWNAHRIYMLRSELMHGSWAKDEPEFGKAVRLAHEITRVTIFRALEIHCLLDDPGTHTCLKDLKGIFDGLQSKKASEIRQLRNELGQRQVSKVSV